MWSKSNAVPKSSLKELRTLVTLLLLAMLLTSLGSKQITYSTQWPSTMKLWLEVVSRVCSRVLTWIIVLAPSKVLKAW